MRGSRFAYAALVLISTACSTPAPPTNSADAAATTPNSSGVLQATPASAGPEATPTATASPPVVMSPPSIAAESFGLAEALHEYWPVIQKAAGIDESYLFGLTVTAFAYSPDGRYVAVAGCDLPVQPGYVYETPGGSCEYSSFESEAHAYAYILDAQSGSIFATLPETGQVLTVSRLAFTHDGTKLVYDFYNDDLAGTVIWDIAAGRLLNDLSDPADHDLGFVAISPDDRWIIMANFTEAKVWDVAQERYVAEIPESGASRFSADGTKLLFEDYPYLVVYDTGTWEKKSQQILLPDGVNNEFAISPDLSMVATCDQRLIDDPRLMGIWDIETGERIQTLKYRFSRCARMLFSPDSRLLLRFDDRGAGPMIWKVDGWKFVDGSDFKVNFTGDEDLYVNSMQFAQDGRTVLVDTVKRLTLYSLPPPEVASLPATQPIPATPTVRPIAPTSEARTPVCRVVVTGELNLELNPCVRGGIAYGGTMYDSYQTIELREADGNGVIFQVPIYLQDRLRPGTFIIADIALQFPTEILAVFQYYDHEQDVPEQYMSYQNKYETSTLILTEAGMDQDYISGSFAFPAHTEDGRQIKVQGTFENIPFTHVNGP